MNYKMVGNLVPAVEVTLNNGEKMYTQSGGMVWQSEGIKMETNTKGGFMKGLGRVFSGEHFFLNTYTSLQDGATIAFASTVPGKIIPILLDETQSGLIIQKGAFLCAQVGVETKVSFTKKIGAGMFGGEGFILQEIYGNGYVFLEADGDVVEKELKPEEVILVDTGNVVAFDKTCSYDIQTVGGAKNMFFGGEGIFLTKITGPGKVILQTQNFRDFAGKIIGLIPNKKG